MMNSRPKPHPEAVLMAMPMWMFQCPHCSHGIAHYIPDPPRVDDEGHLACLGHSTGVYQPSRPPCAHCGGPMGTRTWRATYCSDRCRVAAHRARN